MRVLKFLSVLFLIIPFVYDAAVLITMFLMVFGIITAGIVQVIILVFLFLAAPFITAVLWSIAKLISDYYTKLRNADVTG